MVITLHLFYLSTFKGNKNVQRRGLHHPLIQNGGKEDPVNGR